MCGACVSKADTCMKIYLHTNKNGKFVKETILLALLLCEQFIHLIWINSRHNIQFLSTQQRAHRSFWLRPSLILFAPLTGWINFLKKKYLHEYELQLFA